ncbi:Cytochrome P450 [Lactarius tabidus]
MATITFFTVLDIVLVSTFLHLLFAFRDHLRRKGLPYLPGPKPWPIIGNLLDSPKQSQWIKYTEMSKKHGDILYLQVFGQGAVVLCSLSAIKDLLEKRGEIFSDRPAFTLYRMYGERWREGRKIADRSLRPGVMSLYHQRIEEQTRAFLGQILASPAHFRGHIELSVVLHFYWRYSLETAELFRFQGKIIMSLMYGYDLKENDKIVEAPVQLGKVLGRLVLPGAALQDGTAVSSLAREQLLEAESLNGPEYHVQEDIVKRVLGSMYQVPAGVDTTTQTVSSMASLFVALTLYPEVQKKAQTQIDSVISRDRLPTFEDRSRLPYIEAICKELLRWQVVLPLGFPHASSEDCVYRGFFIPKGSMMVTNSWAILHNPDLYPDPETFKPERFLNEDGTFQDDPTISLAFGAGKRICPGRHLVDVTLFIATACVLSVFDVTKARDENGHEIPVSTMVQADSALTYPPIPHSELCSRRDVPLFLSLSRGNGIEPSNPPAHNINRISFLPLSSQERDDPFISLSLQLEKPHLTTGSAMATIPFITVVDIVLVLTFLHLLFNFRVHRRRRGLPYPPGPKPWPIIGNLLDSPKQSQWITYTEMSKKYGLGFVVARGDILYLQVFGQAIVVLCSLPAIKDLLEKRGEIFSDRPPLPIHHIMEVDWLLPDNKYGDQWRKGRKIAERSLRPGVISQYHQRIEEKTREFLGQILAFPADFRSHIELFQGKTIMSLVYGYDLKENDKMVEAPVQLTNILGRFILPGAALVIYLPFRMSLHVVIDYDPDYGSTSETERQIKGTAQTVSLMSSLFVALTLYPEVQKRAQAQIDSVTSRDRLPTFEDRSRLPYIEAVCKELLRWQIILPLGFPHASSEDCVYRGFFIPKGSITITNSWAILHDPELYPDPEKFKPERFLNEDGTFRDDPTISLAFGAGKRICPGRHLVDSTLFIVAACVLSVFTVTKARDENGHEIPVTPMVHANSAITTGFSGFQSCSDVLYLQVFGQGIVVLCSLSSIKDLLEKRGEIFSDRPALPVHHLTEVDWLLPVTEYGEHWRKGRKIADRSLRPVAISQYHQRIEEKTRAFLGQILASPADFRGHIALLQRKIIMFLLYGYDLKENDKIVEAPVQLANILGRYVLPGAALVTYLPFLRHIPSWVPWLSYEPLAQKGRELSRRIMNEPIDFVKNAMQDGTAVPSLAREQLLEVESLNGPEYHAQEDVVKRVLGSMYQEVQKRAQAQIDSVISRDRLPTFEDRSRLPYIEAICKELLRWQINLPLGFPHASSEDCVYRGLFIPKGSITITNSWAILHDPELYPDPETFKPERFLNEDGTFRDDPTISLAFGAGKRICPGRHLVDTTLFIVTARVLAVFSVTKARDENGHEIPVTTTVQAHSALTRPVEFECSITPRDKVAEDLITENVLA